jgi:hypothetical protein
VISWNVISWFQFKPLLSNATFAAYSEDTAKYLRNLDLASAYYDPKTRSMVGPLYKLNSA